MSNFKTKQLAALLVISMISANYLHCTIQTDTKNNMPAMEIPAPVPTPAGKKEDKKAEKGFLIKYGDTTLKIAGKTKIDHYLQKNINLLNGRLPDELEYFKHCADIDFDVTYGKETYGYDALETYIALRHKGVWGKPLSYADKDPGQLGPSHIRLEGTIFGTHSHNAAKSLVWLSQGWLKFALNPLFNQDGEYLQTIKLGWFPFGLGRGIALGENYGMGKELLGLYTYSEDKGAPGVVISGTILKDRLTYDLYYAKFDERGKSLGDTMSMERFHIIGHGHPWRGENKDDDLVAATVNWKPFNNHENVGTVEIKPYIFYNMVSAQRFELLPDAWAKWGSYGLSLEHSVNGFEWGGEVALNYGVQQALHIDRNVKKFINRDGNLVQIFSHILDVQEPSEGLAAPRSEKTLVTSDSKKAAAVPFYENNEEIPGFPQFKNDKNRFRPAFKNIFGGWMGVIDAAYTIKELDLKFAVAYAYTSGDINPASEERDKCYKGFIGLHEWYSGKRVKSLILLDERLLKRPVHLRNDRETANDDISFSDIQYAGFGATWAPKYFGKGVSINPNVLLFCNTHDAHKYDRKEGKISHEKASHFMGTELNCISRCGLIGDLTFLLNLSMFFPGQFFRDVAGVPLGRDEIKELASDPANNIPQREAHLFRLGSDNAYHCYVGLEYKF